MANVCNVTLSVDTGAYGDGDLLADTQEITNFHAAMGQRHVMLQNVTVTDDSDQKIGFDIYLVSASTTWGTENNAPTISDANAAAVVLSRVQIAAGDYTDIGGAAVAFVGNLAQVIEVPATRKLYLACVSRGAGTYAADALKLKLAFVPAP